jgi:putative cofactor-binding repeat protein
MHSDKTQCFIKKPLLGLVKKPLQESLNQEVYPIDIMGKLENSRPYLLDSKLNTGFCRKSLTVFLICMILLSPFLFCDVSDALTDQLSTGAILIKSDGTIEGSDKLQRNGNVYTLTSDVYVEFSNYLAQELTPFLVIEKDNVVVNGAGHTVTSNGTGMGIYARGVQGVTIANFTLKNFTVGFSSYICDLITPAQSGLIRKLTHNNQLLNNIIEVVNPQSMGSGVEGWGIFVEFSEDIVVNGNTIKAADSAKGLYVGATCNRTTITNNKFVKCGLDLYTLAEKTLNGNTIDDKPVVFVTGKSHEVIDGGEQVFVYNCHDITVRNVAPNSDYRRTIQLQATDNSIVTSCKGVIALTDSTNNSITNNPAKTVALFSSNFNRIFSNDLSVGYVIFPRASYEETYGRCIDLSASKYNDIYNNTIRSCTDGIHLGEVEEASQYNNIYQNNIYNVGRGIFFTYSHKNFVYSNRIYNCSTGLNLQATNDIVGAQNNITDCGRALYVMGSNNQFYHNNFVNNTNQVSVAHQMLFSSSIVLAYSVNNTFDAGYIAGGNYWSIFQGLDSNGDGVSEAPYEINSNNSDRYPFMQPIGLSNYVPPEKPPVYFDPPPTPTPTPTPTLTPTATPTSPPQTTTNTPTPTPTATYTQKPLAKPSFTQSIIKAITDQGAQVELLIIGNITNIQMSNATITNDQMTAKTTITLTVTGQSGTTGFSNITIPKTSVTYGTTPKIYIDNQLASNQGFTQDSNNYYVWYTTNFSSHQISITFTMPVSPSPTASNSGSQGQSSLPEVVYGLVAAIAVVIAVVIVLQVITKRQKSKSASEKVASFVYCSCNKRYI